MKLMRVSTLLTLSLALASGSALFFVSQQVQIAENSLRALQVSVVSEREAIRVLSAEWDYLNRPDRLETLAHNNLDMSAPEARRIMQSVQQLPDVFMPVLPSQKPPHDYFQPAAYKVKPSSLSSPLSKVSSDTKSLPLKSYPSKNQTFQSLLSDLEKKEDG